MSMRNKNKLLALSVAAALACAPTTAQNAGTQNATPSTRPTAFTNARIVTVSGDTIENGTLVIKNGKIEAVGKDVVVPAGAKVIDATGKTIMPGLVSAWSSAGLTRAPSMRSSTPQRGRRRGTTVTRSSSGGSVSGNAATKVMDGMYARQSIFGELLEVGVTSLALTPPGGGFPGLGAVLNPAGSTRDDLAIDDEAFVQIGMQRNAGAKKLLQGMFEKAKKEVEEREKPPEPPAPAKKPEAEKAAEKPGEAKPPEGKQPDGKPPEGKPPEGKEPPKPAPTPAPKQDEKKQDPKPAEAAKAPPKKPKDPNVEVIADLLQGKRRAILQIDSAADLLHWRTAVDDDVKFPRMVAVLRHDSSSGTIDLVIDHLKKWECSVLLPASLSTLPRTAHLTNPAKKLHDAGIEIGFDIGDSPAEVRTIFFRLMELVRSGLPADVAIKAITQVPAKALGIDKRTGTIEAGKDADLLVFDGEPLSPLGKLEQVWLRGSRIPQQ